MKKLILLSFVLLLPICSGKHIYPEKYYQKQWCDKKGGIMEYRLSDKTRVDCLTDKYAVEFDFAPKYHECLGQALHYAARTNKQGVCVLIIEKPEQKKYVYRLRNTIRRKQLNVRTFTIKPVLDIALQEII